MGINIEQLENYIITPTLKKIGVYSESAVCLLLGTVAQESLGGKYLHQVKGPALSIFQIEMATHNDLYKNYLKYYPVMKERVQKLLVNYLSFEENLMGNLYYATAICRLIYYRVPEKLPAPTDIEGLANYWKRFFNSSLGKGTVEQFIDNYKRFVIR